MNDAVVKLRVEGSPVEVGGRARVNTSVIDELDIEEGNLVVITSNNQDILVNIYSDELMEEGAVKLRKEDRDKLKVKEDSEVKLRVHQSLLKQDFLDKLL